MCVLRVCVAYQPRTALQGGDCKFGLRLESDSAICSSCQPQRCRCCCLQKGDAASKLAISDLNSPAVHIFDVSSGSEAPIATLEKLHTAAVKVMRFNAVANTVISSDAKGV